MNPRNPFKPIVFKNPKFVKVQNIADSAMVYVIDSNGRSHTFYAQVDMISISERKDISRKVEA